MYIPAEKLTRRTKECVQNGAGTSKFLDLATEEQMYGHARLFSQITLDPGCSIGYHTHQHETEFYFMLQGEAAVNDNGTEITLRPGDVTATAHGEGHSIENRTDEPVVFMALIVME